MFCLKFNVNNMPYLPQNVQVIVTTNQFIKQVDARYQ